MGYLQSFIVLCVSKIWCLDTFRGKDNQLMLLDLTKMVDHLFDIDF